MLGFSRVVDGYRFAVMVLGYDYAPYKRNEQPAEHSEY